MPADTPPSWSYRPADAAIESATWAGDMAPALGWHFHAEDQITLVLSGSRGFRIDGQDLVITAGQALHIPAGIPHLSLPHRHDGTHCLNLYIAPQTASPSQLDDDHAPIREIASRHGLSREGFSRAFLRRTGMPPHAYRLVCRLNDARRRLRAGEAIADIAADLGFADQSHLGRHFRRVFGTSPRAYRDGVRSSQTFQTGRPAPA